MMESCTVLTDQPCMLVLPDGWQEEPQPIIGQEIMSKAKVATPRKASAANGKNGTRCSSNGHRATVSDEDIRVRAYFKWTAAGKPLGDGTSFWFQAKQELLQEK
jgi:hypothetical protein